MKMLIRIGLLGIVLSLVAAVSVALAEGEHSSRGAIPGQGDGLSMTKLYTGDQTKVGTFKGKLVCLRCDLGDAPGAMKQCAAKGHRHALSMEGGDMIHPLLAGTKEAQEQINSGELHGKNVAVHGNYYPNTGFILADRVTAVP